MKPSEKVKLMPSLITPVGVLSYPKLFKPELPYNPKPSDVPVYSTAILFTKEATESFEWGALQAAVVECAKEKWGARAEAMLRDKSIRVPFRTDLESKGYPSEYVVFLNAKANANSNRPAPQIVGPDKRLLTDQKEIYPGVRARLSLGVYPYDNSGNKGISFGLRNVQKVGDGDRLDTYSSPEQDFGKPVDEPAGGEFGFLG
jgi:hypothetical protein